MCKPQSGTRITPLNSKLGGDGWMVGRRKQLKRQLHVLPVFNVYMYTTSNKPAGAPQHQQTTSSRPAGQQQTTWSSRSTRSNMRTEEVSHRMHMIGKAHKTKPEEKDEAQKESWQGGGGVRIKLKVSCMKQRGTWSRQAGYQFNQTKPLHN